MDVPAQSGILAIGIDITDIRRIEKTLERFGDRFTRRCFTERERVRSDRRGARAPSYARRWAAKEACAKALGTGFRRGVSQLDIGIVNLPGGRPTVELSGGAAARLSEMTPAGMTAKIDVSLTDEPPLAQALVIISLQPQFSEPV